VGSSRQISNSLFKNLFNLGSQSKSVKIMVTADQNQTYGCCQEKKGAKGHNIAPSGNSCWKILGNKISTL
jgi:hypothetical protein